MSFSLSPNAAGLSKQAMTAPGFGALHLLVKLKIICLIKLHLNEFRWFCLPIFLCQHKLYEVESCLQCNVLQLCKNEQINLKNKSKFLTLINCFKVYACYLCKKHMFMLIITIIIVITTNMILV